MPNLLSGRTKVTASEKLSASRFQFVSLSQAQPALGRPTIDNSVLVARLDGTTQWVSQASLMVGTPLKNVLYVTKSGNDNNPGTSLVYAKATIRAAASVASPGTTIIVMSGEYIERNPIEMRPDISIMGQDSKVVVIPRTIDLDVFHLNTGSNIQGINVVNHRAPSYAFALLPNVSITTSPIIKNCSSITGPFLADGTLFIPNVTIQNPVITPGLLPIINDASVPDVTKRVDITGAGGGILVDGARFATNSLSKSVTIENFNIYNQGGNGIIVKNNGVANVQNTNTNFCYYSYRSETGGQLNLNGCSSSYGYWGLTSEGYYTTPYISTGVVSQTAYSNIRQINITNSGSGYLVAPVVEVGPPDDPNGIQATAIAEISGGQVINILVTEEGSGYAAKPTIALVGSSTITATAQAILSGIGQISIGSISQRPLIGTIIEFEGFSGKYDITSASEIIATNSLITVTPKLNYILLNTEINCYNNSKIVANSHSFRYVGSGITYNGLPSNGGIAVQSNEVEEINYGKVFYSSVSETGSYRIGELFSINQIDGSSTISSSLFNLTDISALGPFIRNGAPAGVQLREVSNDTTLTATTGIRDPFTVPTQNAVYNYLLNNYLALTGGTVTGTTTINSIKFENNTISTTGTNQTLNLSPNGTGIIDVNSSRIVNLLDPVSAQDAVTKSYLDNIFTGGGGGGGTGGIIAANIGDLFITGDTIQNSTVSGDIKLDPTGTGIVQILSDIDSIDKDTGALVVEGGVGIEKHLNVGLGITSPTFTGNVTGNVSGSAATVTGSSQTAITQVGTLIELTVDKISINNDTIKNIEFNSNLKLGTTGLGSVIPETGGINFGAADSKWGTGYFNYLYGVLQTGSQPNITDLSANVNIFNSSFSPSPSLDIGYDDTNKLEIITTNFTSSLSAAKFITHTGNLGTSPGRMEFYPNSQLALTIDTGLITVENNLLVKGKLTVLDPIVIIGPSAITSVSNTDDGVAFNNNINITSFVSSINVVSNGTTNVTTVNLTETVDVLSINTGNYISITGTSIGSLNSTWLISTATAGTSVITLTVNISISAGNYTEIPTLVVLNKKAFFGYQRSNDAFTFISNAIITNDVVTGTIGTIQAKIISNDATITGGSINNVSIGLNSPSTGNFTSLVTDHVITNKLICPSGITIVNATPTVIDSFDVSEAEVVKYVAKIKDNITGAISGQEIMLVHNNINVYQSEYGIVHSNESLGQFSSNIANNTVSLQFTPFAMHSTVVKIFKFYA